MRSSAGLLRQYFPKGTDLSRYSGDELEAVECATLEWVDWFNMRRLLGPIGDVPPAEFEAKYYEQAAVA